MRTGRVLAAALLLTACTGGGQGAGDSGGSADADVEVAVAAYPFAWLVEQVGGEDVRLVDLAQDGVEPHDVELGPRQVAALEGADLVVTLRGFQPAFDDAVQDDERLFDLAPVIDQRPVSSDLGDEEGGLDPHVWLDPVRTAAAAEALGARLEELVPGSAERGAATAARLRELDAAYRDGLAGCARRELVTSHTAFGYLADRYDLQQVGVSGASPEEEPSPARLAEVVRFARSNAVTTVFAAPGEAGAAETVAREVGARTATLSTLETAPEDGDYLSAMREGLQALRAGLGCA